MRSLRIFVTVLVAGSILSPVAGDANDTPASCGAGIWVKQGGESVKLPDWRDEFTCHFAFNGFPIVLQGDAFANEGNARLQITVSLRDVNGVDVVPVPLLSCSAVDADTPDPGQARCSAGLPDETTALPWSSGLILGTLYCHVEGVRHGMVLCSSGLG